MTDAPKPTTAPAAKPKPANSREDRLAARLRENLRKRKDQARQREQSDAADGLNKA
jgi:hypothetical protein